VYFNELMSLLSMVLFVCCDFSLLAFETQLMFSFDKKDDVGTRA
jgi:hypothetical protein